MANAERFATGSTPEDVGWLSTLERDTHAVLAAVENLSADLSVSLRDGVDRRPLASLGIGFFAGYVLGGGVTLRLATLLLATAGRAMVANAVATAVGGARR